MVERQPSKLNVASSNLVSRSSFPARRGAVSVFPARREPVSVFSACSAYGPACTVGRVRSLGRALDRAPVVFASVLWRPEYALASQAASTLFAHLAQSVERVLGKDEVTSSILVVGSNRPKGSPTFPALRLFAGQRLHPHSLGHSALIH